MEVGGR